jgi:hypothetical protein
LLAAGELKRRFFGQGNVRMIARKLAVAGLRTAGVPL